MDRLQIMCERVRNREKNGVTDLMVAALGADEQKIIELIQEGANIKQQDKNGCTAFTYFEGNYDGRRPFDYDKYVRIKNMLLGI